MSPAARFSGVFAALAGGGVAYVMEHGGIMKTATDVIENFALSPTPATTAPTAKAATAPTGKGQSDLNQSDLDKPGWSPVDYTPYGSVVAPPEPDIFQTVANALVWTHLPIVEPVVCSGVAGPITDQIGLQISAADDAPYADCGGSGVTPDRAVYESVLHTGALPSASPVVAFDDAGATTMHSDLGAGLAPGIDGDAAL